MTDIQLGSDGLSLHRGFIGQLLYYSSTYLGRNAARINISS